MQPHHVSVYRYGGEEFAIIFRAEQMSSALSLLEAWRTAVEKRVWREENLRVTFSGGLGEWHFEPLEQFVGSVDNALYSAKQQGKIESFAHPSANPLAFTLPVSTVRVPIM